MFHTALTPPSFDQATVDHYVAKGKAARSRAIVEMVKGLFSEPEAKPAVRNGCAA